MRQMRSRYRIERQVAQFMAIHGGLIRGRQVLHYTKFPLAIFQHFRFIVMLFQVQSRLWKKQLTENTDSLTNFNSLMHFCKSRNLFDHCRIL